MRPSHLRLARSARAIATIVLVGAVATIAACGRTPVKPTIVGSPDSEIVIDSILSRALGLPETDPRPVASKTDDGRMRVVAHIQNRSSEKLRLQVQSTFFDAAGAPIEEQAPKWREAEPAEILVLQATAGSRDATRVRIQVRPAD